MHRCSLKALKPEVPQRSADGHLMVSAVILSRVSGRHNCVFPRVEASDAVPKSG